LACGNGSERTQHPIELFGADWYLWEPGFVPEAAVGGARDRTCGIAAIDGCPAPAPTP